MPGRTIATKLSAKILRDLNIECDPATFERTYAGKNQRSSGTFVWTIQEKEGHMLYGSCWPATECIRTKHKLYLGEFGEIIPE